MTTDASDPRAFQSWEDAFQHPIPVVRKLEQQLRNHADDNREKLRSLVGTSYRSLLSTAETIIDMEVQMQHVESKLARVGRRCNARGVQTIATNAANMDRQAQSHDVERYTFASQLAVLRNAPIVMTRLLKRDASHLLIAKVLVISRLLHKALSQASSKPPIVDKLWERLLSVRRKLLRRIDNRLAMSTAEVALLVDSMSAYALATSSTPTHALQHFLKVRLDKIVGELKRVDDQLAKHGIDSLKLCIQTCLDTQTVFPRKLAEALLKLKAQPLLQDPEVRGLFELNLDVHDRWLGEGAQSYTPWPRHDELQRPDAERILHRWSKEAIAAFLGGVKAALDGEHRLQEVAHLRQELVETWIMSGSHMAGVKSANVLDDLRDAMNDKLANIVRRRSQGLRTMVTVLEDRLRTIHVEKTANVSLWVATSKASDLSNGAINFKSTIVDTFQGRDHSVNSVMISFDSWMDSVLEVKSIVKSMKEARWDDTFADNAEERFDDDLEESKQTLLSDDDPRLLEETTQEALSHAMDDLGRNFSSIVDESTKPEHENAVQQTIFLLRIIRELGDRLPRVKLHDRSSTMPLPIADDTLASLYAVLASHITTQTTRAYAKALNDVTKSPRNSQILWEGNPPLPSQPSPDAFRFLRELNTSMAALGSDLWSRASLDVLRTQITKQAAEVLEKYAAEIKSIGNSAQLKEYDDPSNAEEEKDKQNDSVEADEARQFVNMEDIKRQRLAQLLFDAFYIQRFTAPAENLGKAVRAHADTFDNAAVLRLRKNAADYAKRTYSLFALLA